ncbi:MAG TPA: asparagine synthetase B [candidate division Zixibacteria bacterium]|nr:asparagine synthetase B [candidate division Zixibacteria bacterium]
MRKLAIILIILVVASSAFAQRVLIYMDLNQRDHLKAYGVTYNSLREGFNIEWLLNYRGGSFLAPMEQKIVDLCRLYGVSYEIIDGAKVAAIYAEIEESNMEVVLLEKAPKIAVYTPPNTHPWDDAVTLALTYAEVPYDKIWDEEVLAGRLGEYDWVHLHHEDFTGQFGKFYASYRNTLWYKQEVATNQEMARRLGFTKVSDLKLAVALKLRDYVAGGGFLFAMCSATETIDVALAGRNVDIVPAEFDGDPIDPNAQQKLNYDECFAFHNFTIETNPLVYSHSSIDYKPDNISRMQPDYFYLFEFSAKFDPVPTMLTQNHVNAIKDFLGQNTAFVKEFVKPHSIILASYKGDNVVKYIHGNYGKGTWTFYGGHDPEDYTHYVGDPPTDLNLHRQSPGYRLILNNILFPAAQKKEHKT